MSYSKRKIFASDTSDEDDSFKRRRSSLRVNLSHTENLTDSGNGSLWRTEIENKTGADTARTVRRLSRRKNMNETNRGRFDPDNKDTRVVNDTDRCIASNSETSTQIKEGIRLKHLTINLEDMSTKERHLETSCKHLKDAILSKTKQIFDGENELSIKITKVLGNKENCLSSDTHNPNTGNEKVVLDATDHHLKEKAPGKHESYTDTVSSQQREGQYSNIVATPTNSDGRKDSLEKIVDKSRLTQRRLFVEEDKQVEGQIKCRIVEDVVLKQNFPLLPLRRDSQSGSPILSGSNRRSLFAGRSKLYSQSQFENLNNTYSTIHSVRNLNIETPVVCSTFIEDKADEKGTDNNVDASRATYTTTKVISMEMTEIHGGVRMSEKHMSVQNRDLYTNNCNENSKGKKGRSMKRNKSAVTSRLEDEDVEYPVNISLSDSSNAIGSSLNVNTSLDAMTDTSKARNVRKSSDCRTSNANQGFEATINNKKSIVSNQRESTNTIRTSLQMNTSVDSMRKTWRRISDNDNKDRNHLNMEVAMEYSENKETNDVDFLENMSLIERLRNISVRNEVFRNNKSRVSKIADEYKRRSSNSGDSYSYVEGTPYPISRSVLFRSQLKHRTQHSDDTETCGSNLDSMNNEKSDDKTNLIASNSKISNETHMPIETQKTIEANTVILEDIPSCNPFVIHNQLTVIEGMADGTKSETVEENTAIQNTECVPVRKGRRKLLPLTENSQCSIIPVEESKCTPEESTSAKRNKRPKKKLSKIKSTRLKNNTNNMKHDTTSIQIWSDSDCDVPEKKKTRKPKKVISKKIFIKKFADENMLNILQNNKQNKEDHSREHKDSLDDFVKCRTVSSSQRNKYKSQKIVIVTTGLSTGDKSLVKSIVKSLGAAEMELNVSRRTTHVVSTGVRTVNLLRGIIRGCWLITLEWVLKSLENNAWLDPETFEMKHFSKAVEENRKDRQLFGPSYVPELFSACGFIYVEHKTTVPYDTLKELIKTAGGHITENTKLAKIIIGANGLKETWVIDSITTGELQLTKLYQRNTK